MATFPPAQSLRVLCIDDGEIKGYTSLLILKRIFRTMISEGKLAEEPRPFEVFDLIAGTSTGGLIAVMLGRLHMTIDECIAEYEEVEKKIFGRRPPFGQLGKLDVKSNHATQENYNCQIWEAASATSAAPIYFKHVNREKDWEGRQRGCIVSLGTGVPKINTVSGTVAGFLRGSVDIMTDSEDIADQFACSENGCDLANSRWYFRFSVPQGMKEIELEDYKETEKMKALTAKYLGKVGSGNGVEQCAKSLLYPDESLQQGVEIKPSLPQYNACTHFVQRPKYERQLRNFFTPYMQTQQIFVLWRLGGTGKTQIALNFAHAMKYRFSIFWVRGDQFTNFAADFPLILPKLDQTTVETEDKVYEPAYLRKTLIKLEESSGSWLMILDNVDDLDEFRGKSEQDMCRFQGLVAGEHDDQRVDPMDNDEAKCLLLKSIPEHLSKVESGRIDREAKELLEELGSLPLAVAQAAANIVDQHLSLMEYVSL
ncbi:hypothetical protein BJX65DRAFT_302434 [Aspergillus insuetus]